MIGQPVLSVRYLTKFYQDRLVLDIASLCFDGGGLYALVGPNGSGKTTLLKILSFLEMPSDGFVQFEGRDVNFSAHNIWTLRRQVTCVMQDPLLFHTSVRKNVAYGLWVRGVKSNHRDLYAEQVLATVGLNDLADKPAHLLSSGETRRVAIARALALQPKVLLLDEPTANLDPFNTALIENTLRDINNRLGTTILFTTHDLAQAHTLSEKVIFLLAGRLAKTQPENVWRGTIAERRGQKWFAMDGGIGFYVVTDHCGLASASIDPKDIIISLQPLRSSALNCLSGKIDGISRKGSMAQITIDAGATFVALITVSSMERMNLAIDSDVYLTFKATSVEVYS